MCGLLDLVLPYPSVNGKVQVLEFATGNVVWRDANNPGEGRLVITWASLAGAGLVNPCVVNRTTQPYVGCPTGGGIVADTIMQRLAQR